MNNGQDFDLLVGLFNQVNYAIGAFKDLADLIEFKLRHRPERGKVAICIERFVRRSTRRRAYSGEVSAR